MRTSEEVVVDQARKGIRAALGIGGLVALAFGILILVWPGKTAEIVAAVMGIYALLAGVIYLGIGIFAGSRSGWSRIGNGLLGALFIAVGIVFFSNLKMATVTLAVVIGIMVGFVWLAEGIMAFTTLRYVDSKSWPILYGVISILAGVVMFFSPVYGAALLWLFIGISLAILGVAQMIRAFRFGK